VKVFNSASPPKTQKHTRTKSAPWFSDGSCVLKNNCRKLERKWRMTELESDSLPWAKSFKKYKYALSATRTTHFSNLKHPNRNNTMFLFETFSKLTKNPPPPSSSFTADEFLFFFKTKIESIRGEIDPPVPLTQ
jgi:hypothetical protein